MSVRIRFRIDSWWIAQCKFKGTAWGEYMKATREEFDAIPLAEPGDVWRIEWRGGLLAGYAICCLKCGDIHTWMTATNCTFELTEHSYSKADGTQGTYKACGHSGKASCWDWSGSAEDGTLTAHPSLLCHSCGFHGWLQHGELRDC